MKYNRPDFGFNDYMIFDEDSKVDSKPNGWQKIMDCVKIYPQFERVRNYIDFIHEKKIVFREYVIKLFGISEMELFKTVFYFFRIGFEDCLNQMKNLFNPL